MIRINLIPREERVATKPVGPNWALIALAVAPVLYGLILTAIVLVNNHQIAVLDEMIQEEETALARYRPALAKIDQLTAERAELQSRLDAMESLDRDRRLAVRLLETVNRSVPPYLWIERMEETGAPGVEIEIEGNTFSNLVVSDLIERLEESGLLEEVDLTVTREGRIGETRVVEFSLVTRGSADAPAADEEEAKTAALTFASVDGG